ncbi:MAG: SDR family oxidoreductase [Collimonas sp.]|uniref:SDR family oxidoreductase n=1 Tax=Collimonas sp. TaxID=1963772 RepID=UPI003267F570
MDSEELILITGATGFLGGATVVEAIKAGLASRLLLLVRAQDAAQGLDRLRSQLARLGADEHELAQLGLPQVLCGDLSELDKVAADRRLACVSTVIHCAALATFASHPSLEKTNVDGTLALAALMQGRARLRRFLYIGTAMACGVHAANGNSIPESAILNLAQDDHLVPYTRSKANGENLLRQRFPLLPLVVLRPSIVIGHTRLGCTPSQSIFWVFLAWQKLGALTAAMDDKIDVVPVDWCAGAILQLALKDTLAQQVFHLSAGTRSSRSFRQIDTALAAAGCGNICGRDYERIEAGQIDRLLLRIKIRIPDCSPRLLSRALKLYGEFAGLNYTFCNDNLLAEGVPGAPPFTDYIGLCVATTRYIPISEQMKWDFK